MPRQGKRQNKDDTDRENSVLEELSENDIKLSSLTKKLNALKIKIGHIKSFLGRFPNDSDIPVCDLQVRLSTFDEIERRWSELIDDLACVQGDSFFDEFSGNCGEFSEEWYSLFAKLKDLLRVSAGSNPVQTNSNHVSIPFIPKLPEPKIPDYDGTRINWLEFREAFKTLIHENSNIPDTLKLTYLLGKLKGKAKASIGFVAYTSEGYHNAWKKLCDDNDDRRSMIDVHVKGILDLPRVSKDSYQELIDLVNSCHSHVTSLSAIGYLVDKLSEVLLINIVLNKLTTRLRMEWEKDIPNNTVPTWEQFVEFLKRQCRILQRAIVETKQSSNVQHHLSNSKSFSGYKNRSANSIPTSTFVSNNTVNKSEPSRIKHFNAPNMQPGLCLLCPNQHHWLYMCPKFLQMDTHGRFDKVKQANLCINCLRSNEHGSKGCTSRSCKICNNKHHTLLHHLNHNQSSALSAQPSTALPSVSSSTETPSRDTQNFHSHDKAKIKQVILSTAIIFVRDNRGKYQECRALLDNASTSNYITDRFASQLRLSRQNQPSSSIGINNTQTRISETMCVHIKSKTSIFQTDLVCNIVETISETLPQSSFNISKWNIPRNIILADPCFNISRPVDMLIGGEKFFDLFQSGKIVLKNNQPHFQKTVFGWLCVGSLTEDTHASFSLSTERVKDKDEELQQSLKNLFDIEHIPDKRFLSQEETFCEDHFRKTVSRNDQGRYTVSLPLKQNVGDLGESKQQAVNCFLSLNRRFDRDPSFKKQYCDVIQDYITKGHMKPINEDPNVSQPPSFYLPHHAVIKPTIQQSCFEIIIRFRRHKFVFTSDVNQMYRQIKIESRQTPLQRVVWRETSNDPLQTYELTTVTFGTKPAPYLATRCLSQLATDEGKHFPKAAAIVQRDFYVDDVLSGSDDLNETIANTHQLKTLLWRGCFKLHKWSSNDMRVLKDIPLEDREVLTSDESSSDECLKTLGLIWLPKADVFKFKVPSIEGNDYVSKRLILSGIAKLYDPLGLLAPTIITAKIFVQNLWKSHLHWDDPIPIELSDQWNAYRCELFEVQNIKLDRRILIDNPKTIQLHGFSDASEKGYGACLYVRSIDHNSMCAVKLLCSKTRVAPIKVISIPRLELCAALLLSRLVSSVLKTIDIDFDDVYLWSDSTIALAWIQTPPHRLKTFVANRVNEIQESTINFAWNHVSTTENPADYISRGIMPSELRDLEIWWNGPQFLSANQLHFETNICNFVVRPTDDNHFELKNEDISLVTTNQDSKEKEFQFIERFSSYDRLLRSIAYCLRFYKNASRPLESRIKGELSIAELNASLMTIVKFVQNKAFTNEIKDLRLNRQLSRNSPIISLKPFIDSREVLRVGGRLQNSDLEYDVKHQILLPAHSHLTTLVFRHYHRQHLHAGPQLLVALVRQRFWPINAKGTARQCVRTCICCFKAKPQVTQQIMGNLPAERVTPSRPFTNTGVDLCGPFLVKNKGQRKSPGTKVYVATFVCFVTKGIHLEILSALSTECFIACLKRFIFRRGKPYQIWSDNATNFVGARNELREWYRLFNEQSEFKEIQQFCTVQEIVWRFIPPRAPNFGGLWESSVKSLKHHLKRVASNVCLSYEELHTLIVQVEGILNSRPLSPLSIDPNDPSPLTPGHFLTGGPIVAPAEPSLIGIPQNRLSNWQKISQMTEHFWKRFSIEYIHSLQQRQKWQDEKPNLEVNDVVLIADDKLPSTKWVMGVVLEVVKGPDLKARVALIRTKAGTIKRAISKISKLPLNSS